MPTPVCLTERSARCRLLVLALLAPAVVAAAPVGLLPRGHDGQALVQVPIQVDGVPLRVWNCDERSGMLTFTPAAAVPVPTGGVLYLSVAYLDRGYGKLGVELCGKDGKPIRPDRFLGLTRTDSGKMITARMRMSGIRDAGGAEFSVRIGLERPQGAVLLIESAILQETPFTDPLFAYVISEPWQVPYTGPSVKPADNTTLRGKVMVGYQGWFRTPNDPEGRGWTHWGNIQDGSFTVDMWPDVSNYPDAALAKAGDVKLRSGKQAYLFSSAWPDVVNTHFRWMREHDIDGAFLQRFVSDNFHAINGGPEWVLANVRAAARREGRTWAVEYDVSGYPDAKLLATLKTDWTWLVDRFGILKDPNYACEGGKPVVFVWGLPFPDRKISPATANAVVDFFKNDPKYGGAYVIGGIPGNWRTLDAVWQEHFKNYACVLPWMSESYSEDLTDFKKIGLACYAHVKPGFSWANLKHLTAADLSIAYTPRDGGRYYWKLLAKAAQAGTERLFVGMFDEYDEATAIMPMSDDVPPTPVRPGVGATFFNGPAAAEQGKFVLLPSTELKLDAIAAGGLAAAANYFVRMGGQMVCPTAGPYTFSVEGAAGDDIELALNGKTVLRVRNLSGVATASAPLTVAAGAAVSYRLDCRHGTGTGTLRLLWESPDHPREAVPPGALRDAWGRFITNEGRPPDWWLRLTRMGKEMMLGKRRADSPMP